MQAAHDGVFLGKGRLASTINVNTVVGAVEYDTSVVYNGDIAPEGMACIELWDLGSEKPMYMTVERDHEGGRYMCIAVVTASCSKTPDADINGCIQHAWGIVLDLEEWRAYVIDSRYGRDVDAVVDIVTKAIDEKYWEHKSDIDDGDDKLTATLEAMYECLTDSPEIVDLTFNELQRDGTCSRWFRAFVFGIAAGLVPGRDVIEEMRDDDRAHAEIKSKGETPLHLDPVRLSAFFSRMTGGGAASMWAVSALSLVVVAMAVLR